MYNYLTNISSVLRSGVDVPDFADSLSATQYRSKKWLVDTLLTQPVPPNPKILILGGWYGSYLVPMLKDAFDPSIIYFNDINQKCINVAKILHRNVNIKFYQYDATRELCALDADVVINTSCEHMDHYLYMYSNSKDCLFACQTCDNKNDPGHINTSSTTEEFIKKLALKHILFSGRLNLGHKNRFMVIGQN